MTKQSARGGLIGAGVVALVALTACGGGSGAAGEAEPDYYPLASGNRWVYQQDTRPQPYVVRATGPDSVGAITGAGLHDFDTEDATSSDSVVVASATGVRGYAKPAPTNGIERVFDGAELFRRPVVAGTGYVLDDVRNVDIGVDFDGDLVNDRVTYRREVTQVGIEAVTTPAGTFTDCLTLVIVYDVDYAYSTGAPAPAYQVRATYWYAPRVGAVKVSYTSSGSGIATTSGSTALVAYRVGARTTDSTGPAVVSVAPADGGTVGAGAQVQVTFSEALYGESVNPAWLRVRDGSGAAVAGSVVVAGPVLRFVNTQPFVPGNYTIEVAAGVPDLLGNPSTQGRSAAFTVN